MASCSVPVIERAFGFQKQTAISDHNGTFSYTQLLQAAFQVAQHLLDGTDDLSQERVAFLAPRSFDWVTLQWGIWLAGGIAVPLCESHPPPEWLYVLEDADVSIVIATKEYESALAPLAAQKNLRFVPSASLPLRAAEIAEPPDLSALPVFGSECRALMLYTSGTTGKPKGVLLTHANLAIQAERLVAAWGWSADDRILNVLPLHHLHGILNVSFCALWAGASCEMSPKFDAGQVWSCLARGDLTLFMAVPTIYQRLIAYWETCSASQQQRLSAGAARLRLMVSGSASLPVRVLEKWKSLTTHTLLERYGMTEIGMALSNPLEASDRRAGSVGTPLPGVVLRLVDEQGATVTDGPGEIEVRGPGIFREYWRRPEDTRKAFRGDWFATGDVAVVENGMYRLLGRKSTDIIKTGGFKVSALEIEEVLREHAVVLECAVVGVADLEWGERVCAALVVRDGATLELKTLRDWGRQRLAIYKLPASILVVDELPRNVMGKIKKKEVARLFEADSEN